MLPLSPPPWGEKNRRAGFFFPSPSPFPFLKAFRLTFAFPKHERRSEKDYFAGRPFFLPPLFSPSLPTRAGRGSEKSGEKMGVFAPFSLLFLCVITGQLIRCCKTRSAMWADRFEGSLFHPSFLPPFPEKANRTRQAQADERIED